MFKIISKVLLCFSILMCLCGCGSGNPYVSYSYSVETGDSIKVKLDTSDGYSLSSELPFTITCNVDTLSQGTFILADAYEQYVTVVEEDDKANLLDSGENDNIKYIFWSYNETEYNYAILIKDSNTGVVLANAVSEESAKECFKRLEFELE